MDETIEEDADAFAEDFFKSSSDGEHPLVTDATMPQIPSSIDNIFQKKTIFGSKRKKSIN
jgi:hypothetical protein